MSAAVPARLALPRSAATGSYARGVALTVIGALFWSLSGVLVRLTTAAGSWQIVLYRALAMAATLLLILALRYRGRMLATLRRAGVGAVLAGLLLTGASVLFILSLAHVTVANALFMSGISPFITALVARAWLGEAVARRTILAMLLAAGGVLLMVGSGLAVDGLLGNLLALGSAVAIALVSIFLRRGRQADMTPAVLWSGMTSAGLAALVLACSPGVTPLAAFVLSGHDLALCAAMGSLQLGLGSICYTLGARHLPAAALQLFALCELVFSPLWVWLVVAEVPPLATLAGGALILAASVLQATAAARTPG